MRIHTPTISKLHHRQLIRQRRGTEVRVFSLFALGYRYGVDLCLYLPGSASFGFGGDGRWEHRRGFGAGTCADLLESGEGTEVLEGA